MISKDSRILESFLRLRSESAFRKMYRCYTPAVYKLVLRLLGGAEEEAAEVVQETWLRAVQRLSTFRGQSSFQTWLCGIAVNRCREHFRLKSRVGPDSMSEEMSQRLMDRSFEQTDNLDLESAILNLPNGYRQVFVLHDIEGYTHDEIAELLDIHSGTSKSQLSQARKAIRRFLRAEIS